MMRTKRWERRKDERPAEIVAAALHLFAERGYAATRLDDVAAAANVSKGTVYLYFNDKTDLFKAVVNEAVLPNLDRAVLLVERHRGSTADLLRHLVRHLGGMIETEVTGVPKLVIAEAGNFPEIARFYAETVIKRGVGLLSLILERGIARGEFRPVDVSATVPSVIAPFLMMVLWKHSIGPHTDLQFDRQAVFDHHLDLLLRGLAASPPPGAAAEGQS